MFYGKFYAVFKIYQAAKVCSVIALINENDKHVFQVKVPSSATVSAFGC
jgi:hypothetical protein